MGTRSTYRIIETSKNRDGKLVRKMLVLVYVQFDGYPEGHPKEIAKWLSTGKVVNGISLLDKGLIFNGAGCLAAQFVGKMKDGAGGVYIEPLSSRGHSDEEYLYDIVVNSDTKSITYICYENYGKRSKKLFEGSPNEFNAFLVKFQEKENA